MMNAAALRAPGLGQLDGGACAQRLGDPSNRGGDLGLRLGEMAAQDGDPEAVERRLEARHRRLGCPRGRDRIVGIGPLHGVVGQREIGSRARQRADVVEAGDEREGAGAAQATEGRLEAEQAAQRRRHANGTVGVRAEGERHHAGGDRAARATRRAAADVLERVWVAGRPVMPVHAGEVVGVLAHVERADQHGVGCFEATDHDGVARGRRIVAVDLRAGARRQPGDVDQVLDRERHAGERPERRAARALGVDPIGGRAGALGQHIGERIDPRVERGDARKRRVDRVACARCAVGDRGRDRGCGGEICRHGSKAGACSVASSRANA
jgi:hypothetical protein